MSGHLAIQHSLSAELGGDEVPINTNNTLEDISHCLVACFNSRVRTKLDNAAIFQRQ